MNRRQAPPQASEWRILLRLALPLIVVNVGNQLMGAVDTAIAGRIGAEAQGAVGLGGMLFFATAIPGMGVVMGIDPMTAQAFGAGRPREARAILLQCVWVCVLVTAPLSLLAFTATHSLETVGIGAELTAETCRYVDARLVSLLPLLLMTATRSYLQAAHRAGAIMVVTLAANVFNFAADWLLVFGDAGLIGLGLPALGIEPMGVVGIGWATTAATVFNLVGLLWVTQRKGASDTAPSDWSPDLRRIRAILAMGLPIAVQLLAEIGIFAAAALVAGTMGTVEIAAHQVALQLASLTFMVTMGIAAATSVRVGRAVGSNDMKRVRDAGFSGLTAALVFMSGSAIAMWTMAQPLARLMSSDPAVIALAAELIVIAGAFQLFDGTQVVSAGALRGAGITRWTMGATLVAYWFVGFPALLAFGFGLDLGPHGVWWGLTAGLAVAALLLSGKFVAFTRGRQAPAKAA